MTINSARSLITLGLVFAAAASVVDAQAPKKTSSLRSFEFRGERLGDSLSAERAKMPECSEEAARGVVRCFFSEEPISEQHVTAVYSYIDGRLYGIDLLYKPQSFERIAEVLAAKYASPVRATPSEFRTVGGARTANLRYEWHFREGTLSASKYSSSLTDGQAHIVSMRLYAEVLKRERAQVAKDAAKDLGASAAPKTRVDTEVVAGAAPDTAAVEAPRPLASDPTPYFEFQVEKQAQQIPGTGNLRYPDALRAARVSGEVLAQFIVDADGRYEPGSFKVLQSSHDLFTQAVRNALPNIRFYPAELAGRKVKQLVQQPFTFSPDRQ